MKAVADPASDYGTKARQFADRLISCSVNEQVVCPSPSPGAYCMVVIGVEAATGREYVGVRHGRESFTYKRVR